MSSEKPSWVKSPVPIAFQAVPGFGLTGPPPVMLFPFISQTEACPVFVFCHRMSERPSSLKSPVPIAFQVSPGLGLTGPPPTKMFSLSSQIDPCPLVLFCHRRLPVGGGFTVAVVRSNGAKPDNDTLLMPVTCCVVPPTLPSVSHN